MRWLLCVLFVGVLGDFYMNSPRGSNNKLNEPNNNVQNNNRLFDSQNNDAAGYQVGDNCKGACHDAADNYDKDMEGAGQGKMYYYTESKLYIEWTAQHGCGTTSKNTHCDIIMQYMCDDNMRDGKETTDIPLEEAADVDLNYGRHESYQYYRDCTERKRNMGLFVADNQLTTQNNRDRAIHTRQNNNGERHGYECPEERDYYPYWHPTPWIDIAILTSDPSRCPYYKRESQNRREKGYCSDNKYGDPTECAKAGAEYKFAESHHDKDKHVRTPKCIANEWSRDNHHGNLIGGQPANYMWKIPRTPAKTCVLRIRYNNTSDDYDGWAKDGEDPNREGLTGNPNNDFLKLGKCVGDPYELSQEDCQGRSGDGNTWEAITGFHRLNINTDQFSRVFEDRTHTFEIRERPSSVTRFETIWNYNVRGRRGNNQQTYPAVEYDFVPPALQAHQHDYIHFQWTGSDNNPAGNAGNGKAKTDRSNLLQMKDRRLNKPLPLSEHTMFRKSWMGNVDIDLVKRMAYLDQDLTYTLEGCCYKCNNNQKNGNDLDPGLAERFNLPENCCDRDGNNDEDDDRNCNVLNSAPAYFDGGLVKMYQPGSFHIMSTRNNAYTNRSQKETIVILLDDAFIWAVVALVGASALGAALAHSAANTYAKSHPDSAIAALSCRPIPLCCCPIFLTASHKKRREEPSKAERMWKEHGTEWEYVILFFLLNLFFALYGFFSNYFMPGWENLFVPSDNTLWYCFAKMGGNMLNFNCSVIFVPVMRNLISWLRTTVLGQYIPLDYNINFHILIAKTIAFASIIHIVFHYVNFTVGVLPIHEAAFYSVPGITGHLITLCMLMIFITALPEGVRRNRWVCCKTNGYNVFWNTHKLFYLIVFLLWFHTQKFWIWTVWLVAMWIIEKMLRHYRSKDTTTLVTADECPGNVLRLRMKIWHFQYSAGQYLYLNVPSVAKGEWHPFTISSAPEEDLVEVHIRAGGDWTRAVKKAIADAKHAKGDTFENMVRADGPYGSASELVYDYNIAVLVGAGIGVTPFAAIMKSIKIKLARFACGECRSNEPNRPGQTKPYKVYFYWLCGGMEEFQWFDFLIREIKNDPIIKDSFEFFTCVTRNLDLNVIRKTGHKSSAESDSEQQEEEESGSLLMPSDIESGFELQESDSTGSDLSDKRSAPKKVGDDALLANVITHSGRPPWKREFANLKKKHPGEEIGIFLCGPPALGKDLGRAAFENNTYREGETHFKFHKENF